MDVWPNNMDVFLVESVFRRRDGGSSFGVTSGIPSFGVYCMDHAKESERSAERPVLVTYMTL
jgi:hypothetical protein